MLNSAVETSLTLCVDVPNETWLADNVAYAEESGLNRFGVPFMGKVTGYWDGGNPVVDIAVLAALPGQRNEQERVRSESLAWLRSEMKERGLERIGVPYIEVAYNGDAWVSEGNHRIMVAKSLGWAQLPIHVRYFDGGERAQGGPLYPEKLIAMFRAVSGD